MKLTARQLLALVFLAYGAALGLCLFRRLHPRRPALIPVVTLAPDGYPTIQEAAEEAAAFAKVHGCVARFEFNGIELEARPDVPALCLVNRYHDALAERREEAMREELREEAKAADDLGATT